MGMLNAKPVINGHHPLPPLLSLYYSRRIRTEQITCHCRHQHLTLVVPTCVLYTIQTSPRHQTLTTARQVRDPSSFLPDHKYSLNQSSKTTPNLSVMPCTVQYCFQLGFIWRNFCILLLPFIFKHKCF